MEDMKNRTQMHLTTDPKNMIKWASRINFKTGTYFNGLYMLEMYNMAITCNKPSYIGMNILDLSKLHMMKFHYEVIQKQFDDKADLLYSDTDSLVYSIEHEDIFEWIKENREHFDLSDSIRPDLKDNTNKKVIGKIKDEMNSLSIKEFIALNPKC